MASQFFSPSIYTVVVQSAIFIGIILWSFPMFLVLFTSQAADNQFLPDVLGIKAERWAETAADSWDKHCLGFFVCIFYFIYVNKSIQKWSLKTCDEKQWANQPSSTWKTKYLVHDFETRHQYMLWISRCKVLWASLFMLVIYEIPTVCTTKPPLTKKRETRVMILHHKKIILPDNEQDQSCIRHGLRCLGTCLDFHIFQVRIISVLILTVSF